MKTTAALLATMMLLSSGTRAQTTDFAKITCDDIANAYLEDVVVIGAWMSGYYNAKRDNTLVDSKQIAANTAKVMQFCRSNPTTTVMHAIELLSAAK
jgi:hypothetical protein